MILKDGESLVHLKIRMNKEMSELSSEDAKSYVQEAIRDIFSATRAEKIPVKEARALIESLDPEFYTKPNQLRKSTMIEMYLAGTFIVIAGLFVVMAIGMVWVTIFSF